MGLTAGSSLSPHMRLFVQALSFSLTSALDTLQQLPASIPGSSVDTAEHLLSSPSPTLPTTSFLQLLTPQKIPKSVSSPCSKQTRLSRLQFVFCEMNERMLLNSVPISLSTILHSIRDIWVSFMLP